MKGKKKIDPPALKAVDDKEHQKIVDLVRGRTMEMSFTVHGLPKSRRISGKLADQVAASVKGKRKGVRSSWSMFTSEHPAVRELNAAIRDLDQLRDTWTIVKSAEVKTGEGDKVTIEGGKRLIWDKDVEDFYALFVAKAKHIDKAVEKLQHAMDNSTLDADDAVVKSVKDMDRENAGDAWDESVYPKDLTLVVGVAKDRNSDGSPVLGNDGNPLYVIKFEEYHVSEKLPALLRERAVQRIDQGLSGTIETAMSYAVTELTDAMLTFMDELSNRMKVYPSTKGKYGHLYEAEVIKTVTDEDGKVPPGQVKVLLRYKEGEGDAGQKVTKWYGPMKTAEFATEFKPQTTGEKKKIYPTVIEGIITQLQSFKDKKAKMLGTYGENMVASFEPLLAILTKAKEGNPWCKNDQAAVKLASVLKSDPEVKEIVAKAVADTVELLEEQVVTVKEVHRRRTIKTSLIGKL